MRPAIGIETLLVYRECPCGNWCATGEGAIAPRCDECGEPMWPLGTAFLRDGRPQFGDVTDPMDQRRLRGLGFRATLANEIALAEGKPLAEAVLKARMAHGREPEPYGTALEHAGPPLEPIP